jgi:hypothetical protein
VANIPVEISTAVTTVSTLVQCLGGGLAARWALLTGTPWVDLDDLTTSLCGFVVEHRHQLRPRGVMNVLGQHAAGEAPDVEILDCNPAEAIDEIAADLVQVIAPLVGNVRLILGERGLAPGAAFGARFAAGEGALAPSQALACLLRQPRPFDRLAVGECRKGGETQVDADRRGAGRRGGRINLDGKDHVPLAVLAGEDRGRGLAWKRAVPPHLDLAGYADDSDTAGPAQGEDGGDPVMCFVCGLALCSRIRRVCAEGCTVARAFQTPENCRSIVRRRAVYGALDWPNQLRSGSRISE